MGGLWGLHSLGAEAVLGQGGGRVVMILLPQQKPAHQARLLLTGALGQGHGDSGGPIPVSKWPGQDEPGCAHNRERLLGPCPFSCPDADLWLLHSVGCAASLGWGEDIQKSLETPW